MERAFGGPAAELVILFEDSLLEVRYLRPGASFRAGTTPSDDLAWPDACELLHVGDGGRIEPRTPSSARVGPISAEDEQLFFGCDVDPARHFAFTLGALRVLARPTEAPRQHRLRPRIDWSSSLGVAIIPLLLTFTAIGLHAVPLTTRSLALDPDYARRVHIELRGPRSTSSARLVSPVMFPARKNQAGINPFAAGQLWKGRYDCAQGDTQLMLQIHDVTGDMIHAVFYFDFVPGNVTGDFALTGHYSRATGRVRFDPGAWIHQPNGYVTVGLDGTASPTHYQGDVFGPGCGRLSLARAP